LIFDNGLHQRRLVMSPQARVDAFRARFRAAKPPYNVPPPVIETMDRATNDLIASGAAQRALKAGDSALTFEPARGSAAGVHAVALPIA
jgi:hypothetical protein